MAERRCTFKCGDWNCGSYQFNLYKDGIDQGGFCDVHYWQSRAIRAEALAQPAQKPFGYLSISDTPIFQKETPEIGRWETVYTTPQQRPVCNSHPSKGKHMTRNELLELANAFYTGGFTEREIAFARVIAAVEREACAKVCEAMNHYMDDGEECAAAIRARGNT